ncbi:MAG: SARP family transcriptional regulator [Jiangellaceae bacterium]
MGLMVRLLGRPILERDGQEVRAPRGRKTWALLAYLVLAERPPSRQRLVSLLFADADDPFQTLRWNLSELRRSLTDGATIAGDPVRLQLHDGHRADVQLLGSGYRGHEGELARLGGDLLEGIALDTSPAFEAWLVVERQRLAASCRALQYEAALDALARGRPEPAADLAVHLLELDPLNADYHTVLVRSLAEAGDHSGARLQAARCMDLFRRELRQDAPSSVIRAAEIADPRASVPDVFVSRASARSYLDAGRASLLAGAVDRALEQLRRAVDVARSLGDLSLRAESLVALAGGTIHGVGGRGAEVAGLLHEGFVSARAVGDEGTAAAACRELAFLGVQLGHYERMDAWLDEAERLSLDDAEHARVLGVRGMGHSDAADYPVALEALHQSIEHAQRAGGRREAAWSRSMIGRIHLLRGEPAQAALTLDQALETLHDTWWTAFVPWAESFRAEAALDCGEPDIAGELLEHAWVLATEAHDNCWITTVARGLARLADARGDQPGAVGWVEEGLRPEPWYLWPCANLLDAGCDAATAAFPERADRWADELRGLAARGGLREHVIRAQVHHARLGDPRELAAARHGATYIDNPALHDLLDRTEASS